MYQNKRFFKFGTRHLIKYFFYGLLLDLGMAVFFAFLDILDLLNASFRGISGSDALLIRMVLSLYALSFVSFGTLFTFLLFLIFFIHTHERRIGRFLWIKFDFQIIAWFLLLFTSLAGFPIKKLLNLQPAGYAPWLFGLGFIYILCSLAGLYMGGKPLRFTVCALRVFFLALVLPIFFHLALKNADLVLHKKASSAGAIEPVDQRRIRGLNVLLITIDTCRADKLSCYQFARTTSPNIDGLAGRGFVFDMALSASNWTKPAVASLFTSVYPSTHQTNTLVEKIPSALWCLPEYFKRAGYHTAVFSANANVTPDFGFDQGVDYFYETARHSMIHFSALFVKLTALSPYLERKLQERQLVRMVPKGVNEEEVLYNQFVRWLDKMKYAKFFANVHFNAPHAPYNPPAEYDIFAEDSMVPVSREEPKRRTRLSEAQIHRLLSLYYGEIFYTDALIGKIIDALKTSGLFSKTIIAVTADHGEEFYDHQSWGHAHTMFNELLHIPLILYVPGHPSAPARIQNKVSIIDIGPTLLNLAGITGSAAVDGKDFSPLLQGEPDRVHDFLFAESLTSPKDDIAKYAVISDDYKYVEYDYGPKIVGSFFNLKEDFEEKKQLGLYSVPDHAVFKKRLGVMKRRSLSRKADAEEIQLSEEKREQLKALGYMNESNDSSLK